MLLRAERVATVRTNAALRVPAHRHVAAAVHRPARRNRAAGARHRPRPADNSAAARGGARPASPAWALWAAAAGTRCTAASAAIPAARAERAVRRLQARGRAAARDGCRAPPPEGLAAPRLLQAANRPARRDMDRHDTGMDAYRRSPRRFQRFRVLRD